MSVVLAVIGSVLAPFVTIKAARQGILGWVLGPIVGFFSSFLMAGTVSAIISYYIFGAAPETINAGEGVFIWVFWIAVIPALILNGMLILGTVR
ncbi:hypothetical protein [Halorubrum halophilum]|uniref:hypothetical protein n=1 Tax=Halorubrum halophilum TaxID=413816 RepID=UPI00186B37D4|nr:hypothetical protein [Halorubrum halophilum]